MSLQMLGYGFLRPQITWIKTDPTIHAHVFDPYRAIRDGLLFDWN